MWSDSGDPYTAGKKKCKIFSAITLSLCLLIVLIALIIATVVCYLSGKNENETTIAKGALEFAFPSSTRAKNYLEAKTFCNFFNKNLPHPKNQVEEDEIIGYIEATRSSKCRFVFFGYVADFNVRYRSVDDKTLWPSLKMMPNDSLPVDFSDCYILTLSNKKKPKVVSRKNCSGDTGMNLLFLTKNVGELCYLHRFKCVQVYQSVLGDNVTTSDLKAKDLDPSLSTVVPYDKDNHPTNLMMRKLVPSGFTITKAAKYVFRYNFNGDRQPYQSNRFVIVDPEHDCLAYDSKIDKLVTRSCEDNACTICV